MTPKQKAEFLLDEFFIIQQQIKWTENENYLTKCAELNEELEDEANYYWKELARKSALICIDEILKQHKKIIVSHNITAYKSKEDFNNNLTDIQNQLDSYVLSKDSYWEQVKNEINNL